MARLAFLAVLVAASATHAESSKSSIDVFLWRSNATFDLKLTYQGARFAFKGELKENDDSTETSAGELTARVTSYPNFVSIIVTKAAEDTGQLYILERQNADFEQLNSEPILGRAAALPRDLQYSIERFNSLQKLDGKDPSFCFRTMVDYFKAHPDRTLDSFADGVEKGVDEVRAAPKPETRVSGTMGRLPPPLRQPGDSAAEQEGGEIQNPAAAGAPPAPRRQRHPVYQQHPPDEDWAYRQQQREFRRRQRQPQQQWPGHQGGWGQPQRRSDAGPLGGLFNWFQ